VGTSAVIVRLPRRLSTPTPRQPRRFRILSLSGKKHALSTLIQSTKVACHLYSCLDLNMPIAREPARPPGNQDEDLPSVGVLNREPVAEKSGVSGKRPASIPRKAHRSAQSCYFTSCCISIAGRNQAFLLFMLPGMSLFPGAYGGFETVRGRHL